MTRPSSRLVSSLAALLLAVIIAPVRADLTAALDGILRQPALGQGHVGLAVYDAESDRWLYESDADRLFVPASVFKLLTCAYALEALGPDRILDTTLVARGRLSRSGAVHGDLILVGGGDPFSGPDEYRALARQAYEAGVRRISGGVAVDDTRFELTGVADGWCVDDLQYWYGAIPGALNVNRQRVLITVEPADPGQSARVRLDLPICGATIRNECLTAPEPGETDVRITKTLGRPVYTVAGTIAEGAETVIEARTFEDPSRLAGELVRDELKRLRVGIGREDVVPRRAPGAPTVLARVPSAPVGEIVRRVLKTSDNFAAELLSWNAAVAAGKGRSYAAADQALYDWFVSKGLPMEGIRTADASGLSRYNLVTPRFVCRLLALMRTSPHASQFRSATPVFGVDGTLSGRLKGTPCEGRVSAKTGWMSRTIGLAGYAPRPDGTEVCFAFFQNAVACPNDEALDIRDSVPLALVTEP